MSLRNTYKILNELGIVKSQRDFGKLVNRSQSYLSSCMCRNRELTIQGICNLRSSINKILFNTEIAFSNENDSFQKAMYADGICVMKNLLDKLTNSINEILSNEFSCNENK